jgi:hypothetical protein
MYDNLHLSISLSALNCLRISSTGSAMKSSNLSTMLNLTAAGDSHLISSVTLGIAQTPFDVRSTDSLLINTLSSLSSNSKRGKNRETPKGRDVRLFFDDGRQIGKFGKRI